MTKQNEIPYMVRQGDVLIVRRNAKPPRAGARVPKDAGRVVLAYGEVTGHAHAIVSKDAALFERVQLLDGAVASMDASVRAWREAERHLTVRRKVTLRHEEHGPIELPPGDYDVIRQREYDPWAARMVAD